MAQFIVRHLEETVKARLKRRAARRGRSMEEEVRHILRDAVKEKSPCRQAWIADCGAFCESRFERRAAGITRSGPAIGEVP